MKRIWIYAIAVMVAVAFLTTALVYATPQFAQKTGKPCTYCHKSPTGGPQLTAAGQYYKTHGKLPPPKTTKPAAKATKPMAYSKAYAAKGPSMHRKYVSKKYRGYTGMMK